MPKKLLSGLFWVLLANLIVKPLWLLGIEVGVQNAVGNEMYGFYFSIFSLSYILNILLDLGITNYNTRNIAQHPQLIQKHLSGILGIKIALLGLYVLVAFSVGALTGYGSREFRLLAWLCLCQFLNSLILYLRSNFEGLLLFRWDSLFSVLDRLIMILICGSLLWSPLRESFDIMWFVYAQAAAYTITALSAFYVIARKSHLQRIRFDWRFLLVVLKQSAPFALLVLLMAAYGRIDSIILQRMAGDSAAGIFAGAFRLLDALSIVAYLVSIPLLPIFARLCKEGDKQQIAYIVRIIFPALMAFAIGAAVTFSSMSLPLMQLLYDGKGSLYSQVFSTLIYSIIPISVTYVFGTLLTANGSLRQLNAFAAISLFLNAAVNIALIPLLGPYGSAWASLAAQSFMAIAQMAVAVRMFKLAPNIFKPWNIALFTALTIAINIAISHLMDLTWWLWIAISAVWAISTAIALRLIDIKEIASIIKTNNL